MQGLDWHDVNMINVTIAPLTQVCCARMADFRRKFTDAARRYIQLSYEPAIHPDERLKSLKCAMICAILSQAGMQCVCVFTCVCWMLLSNQIFDVGLHEVKWAEVIMVVVVSC